MRFTKPSHDSRETFRVINYAVNTISINFCFIFTLLIIFWEKLIHELNRFLLTLYLSYILFFQTPVIPTSHSNVHQMETASPFSIYATVHPTARTAMTKICGYAQQVTCDGLTIFPWSLDGWTSPAGTVLCHASGLSPSCFPLLSARRAIIWSK